jgi:nucleotide-binding universal stress UspA family protein
MSQTAPALVIRRILVALDASPHSLAALEASVQLAARIGAELVGLFVEDTALLRLAEIPCTRELLYFSVAGAPLTRESMESKFRAQSEQIRRTLEASARRVQVAWSFRTVRGTIISEIKAAAAGVDLVALGRGGWSLDRRLRAGSTALEIADSSLPVLLLPSDRIPENAHLIVYYDSSREAQRGLLAATGLSRAGMDGITVLVESNGEPDPFLIETRLANKDIEIRCVYVDAANEAGLLATLRAEKGGILVLGSRALLNHLPTLDTILRETEMPLLLLAG